MYVVVLNLLESSAKINDTDTEYDCRAPLLKLQAAPEENRSEMEGAIAIIAVAVAAAGEEEMALVQMVR